MTMALQLYLSFVKIGIFSIGGGYVMLPLIRDEIIYRRGWLTMSEFIDILAVAEMTPGPVSINTATFVGFHTGGLGGAFLATAGVVTPSFVLILLAAAFFTAFNKNRWFKAILSGLQPAVIALVIGAAIFVAEPALKDISSMAIGIISFLLLLYTSLHPAAVLLLAAIAGVIVYV